MFRGHPEVVDADLADYFGSIPHADLFKSVTRRIVDRRVLHLVKLSADCLWKKPMAGAEDTDNGGQGHAARHSARVSNLTLAGKSLHAPVCAGMEEARVGAKPRLTDRNLRR